VPHLYAFSNNALKQSRFSHDLSLIVFLRLKCDRNLPCENCVKRNLSSSWTYVHAALREKSSSVHNSANSQKDVQSQLRHLEELVISLMNKGNKKGSSSTTSNLQATPQSSPDLLSAANALSQPTEALGRNILKDTDTILGHISIEDDQPSYVRSAHWSAILNSVSPLRSPLKAQQCSQIHK
jgi:hypothetical protein